MSENRSRLVIERLLEAADVQLNGDRPWDVRVHNAGLYNRVLAEGSLGLGEAYMDGWWDCPQLDQFFHRVLSAKLDDHLHSWSTVLQAIAARLTNLQRPSRAFEVGQRHYDIGNDLYERMLDPLMIYSCGYWREAETLEQAQRAKLDLICRKLDLQTGMRVLDIGCGWGGAARYAAEEYGVEVVGLTVSREQARYAEEHCRGLPVEFRLQDYRDVDESFDRIFSIGMFEHVGYKNYRTFMEVVHRCLKKNGRFLLHTIGGNQFARTCDPWVHTYIFPNGMLPSASQVTAAAEGRFVMEDWQNFGPDYDRTLMCWYDNFVAAWPELRPRYGDRFGRMWTYYLLSCAGMFRARKAQLWQVLYAESGIPGGFRRWSLRGERQAMAPDRRRRASLSGGR